MSESKFNRNAPRLGRQPATERGRRTVHRQRLLRGSPRQVSPDDQIDLPKSAVCPLPPPLLLWPPRESPPSRATLRSRASLQGAWPPPPTGYRLTLRSETAIVTGGGQGIGAATCLLFAAEGCRVVVADLDLVKAQSVVDEIKKAGGEAIAIGGDVTAQDFPKRVVEATIK